MASRILFVDTEDQYFLTHRLAPARAAAARGYEVHVATRLGEGRAAIEAEGFVPHALSSARGGLSPWASLTAIGELRAVLRRIKPDLMHNIAVQNVVLGASAALGHDVAVINSLTGLGTLFIPGRTPVPVRKGITLALQWLLSRRGSQTIVQNPDDLAFVTGLGVSDDRIHLIPGWGIDTAHFTPLPEPAAPITAAYVGRMLEDKGVNALIEAFGRVRAKGIALALILAGDCDPRNVSSLQPDTLRKRVQERGIEWVGQVDDIRDIWARAHFAVLPSRREGIPRSLLEAAACERAMVATDAPGCRQVARAGQTALTVPVDDAAALAEAMQQMAENAERRHAYAARARRLVEEEFSTDVICRRIVDLYDALMVSRRQGT
jgi:glycosyltransferase involved in cell wall biosynthesis